MVPTRRKILTFILAVGQIEPYDVESPTVDFLKRSHIIKKIMCCANSFTHSSTFEIKRTYVQNIFLKVLRYVHAVWKTFEVFLNEVCHSSSVAQAHVNIVYWDCTCVFLHT